MKSSLGMPQNELRVWAPNAGAVEAEVDGKRIPMRPGSSGWWFADAPRLEHGADYAFILDGDGPFPDPRSPWQPQGEHGPSRWVDHDRFAWSDDGWQAPPLSSAIIYELHVGTFTSDGTFDSAMDRLDHLVDLGVTHVELMPVAQFPGERGWGYDGVDLFAPHQAYGGPEGLKRFVDACHSKGLAVLLDVVYNHLGPSGNYLSRFGPYFTSRYVTPWGDAVNFDGPGSDEARRFFLDNALMWLRDYHFDGLRLDAVHAIFDASAVHFLEELAYEVKQLEARLGRHLVLIAESDLNDPRFVRAPEAGGYGLHAQWNDDYQHALHAALTGETGGYYQNFGGLAQIAKVLQEGWFFDGCHSAHRQRRHGRPAAGVPGHALVGFLQNHDHIGNRATGERTCHLLPPGRVKIGAALVLTAPFVPMLFQGEEWGAATPFLYFTDHSDPALSEAVEKGRVEEFSGFGWDPGDIPSPQAEETFRASKLDWDELDAERCRDLLEWHRALIRLRRECSALTDGRYTDVTVRYDEDARWLVMLRGPIAVACNLADSAQEIPLDEYGDAEILLASDPGVTLSNGSLLAPSNAAAVLSR